MDSPKILIVGDVDFSTQSSVGITLKNLMMGWDIDNIAVVGKFFKNPDFTFCKRFYQLGDRECKHRFPFNLWKRNNIQLSGELKQSENKQSTEISSTGYHSILKRIYENILDITGLVHYKDKLSLSDRLLKWITDYSPDIIYSMLSSRELIKFVDDLRVKLNIPVAIHIMDDWPLTITASQWNPFKFLWKYKINKEFRHLLSASGILMSISQFMSDEYSKRYGFKFEPFHNPIEASFWNNYIRVSYAKNDPFVILYAGRIGNGLQQSILDIAYTVNKLTSQGYHIEFHIQPTSIINSLEKELSCLKCLRIDAIVPYFKLPEVFGKADLLVIPNDFDKKSIDFLKFSMPTKASEYMVSGSPILIYSSSETAIVKHALKYHWGYIVSDNDKSKLENAILELYNDETLRRQLGVRAREFALNNYDSQIIREKFRKTLKPIRKINVHTGQ